MEKVCQFKSYSPEETRTLARHLARRFQPGDVVLLEGDLGAGKTTFAQGVAIGLGIEVPVDSPTFTLIKEYHGGRFPLYHMDVYRIQSPEEELGWDEYFYGEGVTLHRVGQPHLTVVAGEGDSLELSHAQNCRNIRIEPPPEEAGRICGGLNPR